MSTDKKIVQARQIWLDDQGERFDSLMQRCESPVERLLLAAFLNHGWSETDMFGFFDIREAVHRFHPGVEPTTTVLRRDDSEHALLVQPTILTRGARARVDFAFIATTDSPPGPSRIAIEVDGHDFHERTKQQASRDKARDRRHALSGWVTLRYTGSDVYADADGIADAIFWELAGQEAERQ